ncbi:MAG: acyl-coenzyme A thioesterase PaaI-like protein [Halieaceae bacterium]|jgi:acyl-coenzyme A thioesterase PaaI-like protein
MQASSNDGIPAGFELFQLGLGFIDALAPVYIKRGPKSPQVGLKVEAQHSNLMGICHGGVLMTLLDIGLSASVRQAAQRDRGSPTISMNTEFISAAKLGDWVEFTVDSVQPKRLFGFVSGTIRAGGKEIARGSAVIYLPEKGFAVTKDVGGAFNH